MCDHVLLVAIGIAMQCLELRVSYVGGLNSGLLERSRAVFEGMRMV
jgi:hypothetical protein